MLTKLIKNSLFIFIFIFLLFFGFNNVNAADNGTSLVNNTDFIRYSITYEEQVEQGSWEYIGDLLGNSSSAAVRIYYNKNSRSMLGFKLAGSLHITDNLSIYEYINGFEFNNLAYFSGTSSGYRNSIILSSGDLPILGGSCSSGSFCFMWRNSGSQGNRQSATIRSNTIFLDYLDLINNVVYGSSKFYDYDNGVTYVGTDSPSIELGFSGMNSSNFKVYSTQEVNNNGDYTIPNLNNFELADFDNGLDYEDLNSSGSIEEVEFTHNNITFNHLLKIKISDLYRSANNGYYKPYFLTYMSSISTGVESNFYITYDTTTSGKPNFPLSILFKENLGAIEKIANGSEDDPFSFEYYGNRLPECSIESSIPLSHTTYNDSPNFYNYLLLYPTWYCGYYGDTWEPTIWGNDYIYIYYNARLYNNLDTLEEDFENNPSNFEETNFFNYMVRSIDHFMGRIPSIFKIITIFFNSLPYEIRLMFIAVFTLIITLLIYKVIG